MNNDSTPIQAVEIIRRCIYRYLTTYLHTLRHFNRDVRVLLTIAALIGFTIFGGIYTVLLNLDLLRLGYDSAFIGKANATGLLAIATAVLPAGTLGSRWGMRRTMVADLFLAAVGYGLLPAGELVQGAWRDNWLLATYLLAMLGFVVYVVNATPFLTGATTSSERSHAFGVQAALWPLAGFAGSLCGGPLPTVVIVTLGVGSDDPAVYRYPLLFAAALLLPAALMLLSVRDVRQHPRLAASRFPEVCRRSMISLLACANSA